MTIIAACEAYKMIGLDSQLKFIKDLQTDFAKFLDVNKQDDMVDADGDVCLGVCHECVEKEVI